MKNKNKNTGSICFVDHVQPGIIRFNDGDALDGILAGTRAKAIVKIINEYPALVAVAQASDLVGKANMRLLEAQRQGDKTAIGNATVDLYCELDRLAAVRSGSEVAK